MHADSGAAVQQRMRDVVAVADVSEPQSGEPALALADGLKVGQNLAGVLEVAQAVDDRAGCVAGEVHHNVMAEDASHDHIHVA